MTSLRKLERDFVQADLAAVTGLLSQLHDEDVMSRMGLETRRDELQAAITHLDEAPEQPLASAALFFGGGPVVGTQGIESEFAGSAITKFQDIVAKVLAHETGGLGQRGIVPNKSASTLHITQIVRGSFGFLLEEVTSQPPLMETSLKLAVDEATRLLEALGEPDEELFRTAVEATDDRVLATAREFFELMRQRDATLRLVAGEIDRSFGSDAVERAAERATSTTVEDVPEIIQGQLAGVLPDAHQFEFRVAPDGRTIHGKISRAFTADELARFNRDLVDVDAALAVTAKRVRRNGTIVRESFTMTALDPGGPD